MPSLPPSGWAWFGAAVIALYLLVLAALFALQRQILFRPDRSAPDPARVGQPGLTAERLVTADGLTLMAWRLPGRPGAPSVLYLHGNGGHVGHRAERIRRFAALGWGALFVEYRGYGGNPGTPSEAGLRADAEAGLAALGATAARTVLWGESLGSGLATWLAARHPVGAVVLETPYTSIADIAKGRYWFAPVDWLLRDRFDSLVNMPAIRAPVLIAVAGRDRVVPPAMGRTLRDAASGPAELWTAETAGHTDMVEHGVMAAAAEFVARHIK